LRQLEPHLGETFPEGGNDAREKITGLGVRATDDQAALIFARKLVADALQVVHLPHDAFDDLRDGLTWLRETFDSLTVPLEDLHAQLILELDDGLCYARLRGIQATRRFSQIEVPADRLAHKAELLKVHKNSPVRRGYYM